MLVRNPFTHDSRVEKEAAALAGAGYRVTVVAEWAAGLPRREDRGGYRVLRVPRGSARLPGMRLLQYRSRLLRALRATQPEILHAHDSDALEPVAAVARERRRNYVYDAHELWIEQENRGRSAFYFRLFRIFYRVLERLLVPRAAAVITISPPIARELKRRYRLPQVTLVPNYPEAPSRLPRRSLAALARRAGQPIPDGAPLVLYVGGAQHGRGIEHIVRAVARVPDAVGVFLGSGEPSREIAALARRLEVDARLRFLPPVAPEEVIPYAASASVGITLTPPISLNNRYALPNKLFQYMAAGVAVIASDYEHVREIVLGSRAGLTVDPDDPYAIAEAVARLLADPAEAKAMGRRGRAAVMSRYNWDVASRELLAVYERLSGRGAAVSPSR